MNAKDIGQMMNDLAARLPPESQVAFLAACQNLEKLPLPANRDLATVFLSVAWVITQKGGLRALPEITSNMETVIENTVQNTIKDSTKNPIRNILSPPSEELATLDRQGSKGHLYLEAPFRSKVASNTQVSPQLEQLFTKIEKTASRIAKASMVFGIFLTLLISVLFISVWNATRLDENAIHILVDPEMAPVRQILRDGDTVRFLSKPEAAKILLRLTSTFGLLSPEETLDGIKVLAKCRKLGIHLKLATPFNNPDFSKGYQFGIFVNKAIISKAAIRQDQPENLTLIPLRPAREPLPDLGLDDSPD